MGAVLVRMSKVVTNCEECGLSIQTAPVVSRTSSSGTKKYYCSLCGLKLKIILPKQIIQYYDRQSVKEGGCVNTFNKQRFTDFFSRARW